MAMSATHLHDLYQQCKALATLSRKIEECNNSIQMHKINKKEVCLQLHQAVQWIGFSKSSLIPESSKYCHVTTAYSSTIYDVILTM
jgi:hypothetical protein